MKQRIIICFISLLIIISSCQYDEEKMRENKVVFQSRHDDFEEVLAQLKQLRIEKKLTESTFKTEEARPTLKPKLKALDIISVEIEQSDCEEIDEIEISFDIEGAWFSSWYTPGKFQICYVPCSYQTLEGFEYYDGYHQNTYGLGNHWMMYSDTDPF